MPLNVDATYIRSNILPGLIGTGAKYATAVTDPQLEEALAIAQGFLEQRLSTRFQVTEFQGFFGPGLRPDDSPSSTPPLEYEDAYMWPSRTPGEGYLRWEPRIRPLVQVKGGTLYLPGVSVAPVPLQADWVRAEYRKPGGEIVLMPLYGSTPFALPQLPFGFISLAEDRIPVAVLWNYTAGLRDGDFARFPQLRRLVGLTAAIQVLPGLAMQMNPTGLSSQSADGLSVSAGNAYRLKDYEERLKTEQQDLLNEILDAWDGTLGLAIL